MRKSLGKEVVKVVAIENRKERALILYLQAETKRGEKLLRAIIHQMLEKGWPAR
jgi:hypothetical protein